MHLKSVRLWMTVYVGLTLFDVIVTYIFISHPLFGIPYEGNSLTRNLMERFGIWQGLTLYTLLDFLVFLGVWGCFYYFTKWLIKNRSERLYFRTDLFIFNMIVPFVIMASALFHLSGGVSWILLIIPSSISFTNFLEALLLLWMVCGILQTYLTYRLMENLSRRTPDLNTSKKLPMQLGRVSEQKKSQEIEKGFPLHK